ncbi:hypothetical protein GCM10009853_046890 [Glycomyces scopariae]|uniref:Uncharacterized protein n=1 Tax=Glycomyces sambucus TaxID=380244 RepID=A0A1G9DBC9_9ACTN|nr:hypothetical protein [Glycomyces sambucus]SDK61170.1 hypothetical protein SAMN05216298_0785 [Glycomyces sambucus]
MNMGQSGMLFVFGMFLLVTAIIIAGFHFAATASKARAAAAREAHYRELAEKASVDATEIQASLIEIKSRLASLERQRAAE